MILIATDGACKGNPGKGTWAFAVYDHNRQYVGCKTGASQVTTNNKMELRAILEAVKYANKHKLQVEILTDSTYCLKGITTWMYGWANKGWKTAGGKEVSNKYMWQELFTEWSNGPDHKITKVKGHSGNVYNDRADLLCNERYINEFM